MHYNSRLVFGLSLISAFSLTACKEQTQLKKGIFEVVDQDSSFSSDKIKVGYASEKHPKSIFAHYDKGTLSKEGDLFPSEIKMGGIGILGGNQSAELTSIQIKLDSGTVKLSEKDISQWHAFAPKGIVVAVVRKNGNATTEISIDESPFVLAEPITQFQDPKTTVGSIASLLNTGDIKGSLLSLKKTASATEAYESALLSALTETRSLDFDHLMMLVHASYFPNAFIKEAKQVIDTLNRSTPSWAQDDVSNPDDLKSQVTKNLELARKLGLYVNHKIALGVTKMTDLNVSHVADILNEIIEPSDTSHVTYDQFESLINTLSPLSGADKITLTRVALQFSWADKAEEILMDWFNHEGKQSTLDFANVLISFPENHKKKTAEDGLNSMSHASAINLIHMISAFNASNDTDKVAFLNDELPRIDALGVSDLISMLGYVGAESQKLIFSGYFAKLSDLNNTNASSLAAALTNADFKEEFITRYLGAQTSITAADSIALIGQLRDGVNRDNTIIGTLKVISDKNNSNVATLFALLSIENRAITILRFIDALDRLDTQSLISFSEASPERKSFILLAYLNRVADFTSINAIKIATLLQDQDRDSVLILSLERNKTIETDDFIQMVNLSENKKDVILYDNMKRISNLTATNLAKIATQNNTGNQNADRVIKQGISLLPKMMPTEDWITLAKASYSNGESVLMDHLAQMDNLDPKHAIMVSTLLSTSNKDTALTFAIQQLDFFNAQELKEMAQAAYYKGSEILIKDVVKVTGLTVQTATQLSNLLSNGEKDQYLLNSIDVLVDLDKTNLVAYSNLAYNDKDKVIQKGLNRIAGH